MKCPFCAHVEDKVVDSRESKEGKVIRRVGEYVGHIFDSVRGMPAYVIHEHTGFDDRYEPSVGFPDER